MELRHPLLAAEEIAGLFGRHPQTVEQVLRAELLEARRRSVWVAPHRRAGTSSAEVRPHPSGALRRLIAGALHVAADALYPPEAR
jgi:hypothetical protein